MRESNAHWDEAKRNRSERLTHQSGALVSVSRSSSVMRESNAHWDEAKRNRSERLARQSEALESVSRVVVWCGSQTLTEMKRSGIEVNDWLTKAELWWVLVVVVWCGSQTLTEMKQSGIEVNVWLTKAKLWWVLVVVVGKYLFLCVELRVVERKCYPTRNLLKYFSISSWNYVS